MNQVLGNVLTIRIEAKEAMVPLGSLLRVLRETLAMLREIDEEMSASGQRTLRWQISEVTYHSPLTMTIVGEPVGADEFSTGVAVECLGALVRLEQGMEPPSGFPDAAMERAKSLAMARNDGIASVIFSAPDRLPVEPTLHLAANVEVILKRRFRPETTTLDGTLEAIDTHGKLKFFVYDAVTGKRIRCTFGEELFEEAKLSIRQRVAVSGVALYNRDGRPLSMKAASLRRLRPSSELPKFRPGEGIDITQGVRSEDYVRRMRDAE